MDFDFKKYKTPDRKYFSRKTLVVAKSLIGAYLRHLTSDGPVGGIIVEAEAYVSYGDPGCHAFNGITPRNKVMFGPPGHVYTYFTYGNHWMFNVVTEKESLGCAVLIRALDPVEGLEIMRERRPKTRKDIDLTNGPGKLCAAMGIGQEQYGLDLLESDLRIYVPDAIFRRNYIKRHGGIVQTMRIGLTGGADLLYRFFLQNHPCVSVRHRNQAVPG